MYVGVKRKANRTETAVTPSRTYDSEWSSIMYSLQLEGGSLDTPQQRPQPWQEPHPVVQASLH